MKCAGMWFTWSYEKTDRIKLHPGWITLWNQTDEAIMQPRMTRTDWC